MAEIVTAFRNYRDWPLPWRLIYWGQCIVVGFAVTYALIAPPR